MQFNKYTIITAVNKVKQPLAIHLAISEARRCRLTNFGEIIEIHNSGDTNM